jgi:hypothetical protein
MITIDNDTGDKFFAGINDTGEQFSLVTTTPAITFFPVINNLKFITGVNDTDEKLFTIVNNTADKFFCGVNDTGD